MNPEGQKREIASETKQNNAQFLANAGISNLAIKDKKLNFIYLKAQRIVSALYVITGFFHDREPSKWLIRKLGNSLLVQVISLSKNNIDRANVETTIKTLAIEINSILEATFHAGLISEMNLSILRKELSDFVLNVRNLKHTFEDGGFRLQQSFFVSEDKESYENSTDYSRNIVRGEVNKGGSSIKDNKIVLNREEDGLDDKQSQHGLKDFSAIALKKNKRQSIIINLIRRKKEIMVKDVSEIISDCSEKTIQRELLSLVKQGILRKEGERRWTKYSLAS